MVGQQTRKKRNLKEVLTVSELRVLVRVLQGSRLMALPKLYRLTVAVLRLFDLSWYIDL